MRIDCTYKRRDGTLGTVSIIPDAGERDPPEDWQIEWAARCLLPPNAELLHMRVVEEAEGAKAK